MTDGECGMTNSNKFASSVIRDVAKPPAFLLNIQILHRHGGQRPDNSRRRILVKDSFFPANGC